MTSLQPDTLIGATVVDPNGDKIGKVGKVYLDDRTGQPAWVTVNTGLLGSRGSFAPLYGARHNGEDLVLQVTKDQVKDAPNVEDDEHINDDEQRALYDHYAALFSADAGWASWQSGGYQQPPTGAVGGPGSDTSGRNTDDAMARSEERLHVGTEQAETGRARLRKYVLTENVTQTVPVSHEEVRVEREPITEDNVGAATEGPEISEAEQRSPCTRNGRWSARRRCRSSGCGWTPTPSPTRRRWTNRSAKSRSKWKATRARPEPPATVSAADHTDTCPPERHGGSNERTHPHLPRLRPARDRG